MSHGPEFAMDYPALPDDKWVIWSGNEHVWPSAKRDLFYLTDQRRQSTMGFALFTSVSDEAKTFDTREEAKDWLAAENVKRPHPYEVHITTVAELKRRKGYSQG